MKNRAVAKVKRIQTAFPCEKDARIRITRVFVFTYTKSNLPCFVERKGCNLISVLLQKHEVSWLKVKH